MFNPMQMMQMFTQFKQNPMAFMASRGMNVPQQYMQTPEMAAKYLMQQRGMNQDQINNLMQTANQFQGFLGGQN